MENCILCVCTSGVCQPLNPSFPVFAKMWNKIYAFSKHNNSSTEWVDSLLFWCHWDVPFPILIGLLPGDCALLFNLHFLCGILNSTATVQSPTHIIIHLFPGYSWGIYQRDTEGSIYQRIHHVHQENPVTRKAHKNKKDLITLLAQSEWMDCFC